MQNTKRLLTCSSLLGLSVLTGCSFPGVYKVDIQQGNIVSQDMVDMLEPGMTRSQSRFVMGTPMITDTFHPERWDYVYTIQPGGGSRLQERQTLKFSADEKLAGLAGDFMPGMSRDAALLNEETNTVIDERIINAPQGQAKPGSLEEQIQIEVDSVEVIQVPTPEPLDVSPQ